MPHTTPRKKQVRPFRSAAGIMKRRAARAFPGGEQIGAAIDKKSTPTTAAAKNGHKLRTVTRSEGAQVKNRRLKAAQAKAARLKAAGTTPRKAAAKTTPRKAALASLGGEQIGAEVASGSTMGGWQRVMKEMNKRRLAARKATVVRAGGRWPKTK